VARANNRDPARRRRSRSASPPIRSGAAHTDIGAPQRASLAAKLARCTSTRHLLAIRPMTRPTPTKQWWAGWHVGAVLSRVWPNTAPPSTRSWRLFASSKMLRRERSGDDVVVTNVSTEREASSPARTRCTNKRRRSYLIHKNVAAPPSSDGTSLRPCLLGPSPGSRAFGRVLSIPSKRPRRSSAGARSRGRRGRAPGGSPRSPGVLRGGRDRSWSRCPSQS
jgi:hypothetical protein